MAHAKQKLFADTKIQTRVVTKDGIHLGWKVYIDGGKYPKKPQDFYGVIAEEEAVRRAWQDYNRLMFLTNTPRTSSGYGAVVKNLSTEFGRHCKPEDEL